MKKNTLLLIAITGFCLQCIAQQAKKTSAPIAFRSINLVGMNEGQGQTAFQLQTINGAQYKGWFAGLGVGLDYYNIRTVPLFLDLRKDIQNEKSTPFVYADGGINYVWQTSSQKSMNSYSTYSNQFFYDFGIGYKAGIGKQNALMFSIGYSQKYLLEKSDPPVYTYYGPYYNLGALQDNSSTYSYTFRRLSVKIGWEF